MGWLAEVTAACAGLEVDEASLAYLADSLDADPSQIAEVDTLAELLVGFGIGELESATVVAQKLAAAAAGYSCQNARLATLPELIPLFGHARGTIG